MKYFILFVSIVFLLLSIESEFFVFHSEEL